MRFSELNLKPELVASLKALKLENATEVQEKAVPLLLAGADAIIRSKTGSGKTFAFLLPILQRMSPNRELQAIILAPTRELAQQTFMEVRKLDRNVRSALIYGGVSIGPQEHALHEGAQIAIATPGRMLDLMQRRAVDFSNVQWVVLDEADRMLDMGFIDDVEKILRAIPKTRQTALFSATLPDKIAELSSRYMNSPQTLMLQQDEITVKKIRQQVFGMDRRQKLDLLMEILKDRQTKKTIIFSNTKTWAEKLGEILWKRRFKVTSIHSGLSQNKRNRVIIDFNSGLYNILVATDVAARGLHIENVTHVINYDIPRNPKDYVHRIGRTGRAGKEGDAITFVTQEDEPMLRAVESEIKMFLDVQRVGGGIAQRTPYEPSTHPAAPHQHREEVVLHAHGDRSGDDWGLD
ncbi:MAG TPA: DEAD/DEAH box helicase [Candidatus Nanoarchaeia archaeon]|nr:DEAD/DEAH box helicase [Candidatus Nanoarchaeia archaeon]